MAPSSLRMFDGLVILASLASGVTTSSQSLNAPSLIQINSDKMPPHPKLLHPPLDSHVPPSTPSSTTTTPSLPPCPNIPPSRSSSPVQTLQALPRPSVHHTADRARCWPCLIIPTTSLISQPIIHMTRSTMRASARRLHHLPESSAQATATATATVASHHITSAQLSFPSVCFAVLFCGSISNQARAHLLTRPGRALLDRMLAWMVCSMWIERGRGGWAESACVRCLGERWTDA
ncbi:hypothetical protein BC567DRAFT_225334 [Phyllosticta citribraziliensis]